METDYDPSWRPIHRHIAASSATYDVTKTQLARHVLPRTTWRTSRSAHRLLNITTNREISKDVVGVLSSVGSLGRRSEEHQLALQILGMVNITQADTGLMFKQGTTVGATTIAKPSSTPATAGITLLIFDLLNWTYVLAAKRHSPSPDANQT